MRESRTCRINSTRQQFIWQVRTTAIDIPRQFKEHHVTGFEKNSREIWTRHSATVKRICRADALAGGDPWPFCHEYMAGKCLNRDLGMIKSSRLKIQPTRRSRLVQMVEIREHYLLGGSLICHCA